MLELISFKHLQSKKYYFIFIITLLIIIILLKYQNKYVSNIYTTYGMVECNEECIVDISLDYQKTDIIKNSKIKIEDKEVEKYEYIDIYLENNIPMQEIRLYPQNDIEEKIVKVEIEYNKQRIINKIKNIIIER